MENALEEDLPIGVYRTEDKIKNLKISVKLRKIANACFTEKDSLAFGDSNELELVNFDEGLKCICRKSFQLARKKSKNRQT
ncbi:meckel syndrome type 1 [Caerostris extrusa]|uniref:Meckel syndrome type 1 n=1 Tax=Caerostris extrusa TaxID=172846 RepID=A0AAV4SQ36_CAEEX|nr:meckel syndrome type 1 [Caerostris extrusa]